MPWINLIAKHPFFSMVPLSVVEGAAQQATIREFDKDAMIYSQGDKSQGLFFILRGNVRIFRSTDEGKEVNLRLLRTGQSFGDVAAFDGGPVIGSAQAATATTVLVIGRRQIRELLREHPEIALGVLNVWAARLREMSDLATKLSLQHVSARVAGVILKLSANNDLVELPKKQDLATTVGTVREVATRAVKDLETRGLIKQTGRRQLQILDRSGLESLSGKWPIPPPAPSTYAEGEAMEIDRSSAPRQSP